MIAVVISPMRNSGNITMSKLINTFASLKLVAFVGLDCHIKRCELLG